MNVSNSLKAVATGLLVASAASVADAQTVVHITGSTAFRSAVHASIQTMLSAGGSYTYAYYGNAALGKATSAVFSGNAVNIITNQIGTNTTYSTNLIPTIIKTYWSGSVGGVQTVSQQLNISTWLSSSSNSLTTSGNLLTSPVFDAPAVPEVSMEDGIQANTPFPSPALVSIPVGVATFKWIVSSNTPAGVTNITPLLAQQLYLNGSIPVSQFTGNAADSTNFLFAVGRDPDSGTRQTAFEETGIGNVDSTVVQYYPLNGTNVVGNQGGGPINGLEFVPTLTINGITFTTGIGGYNSGGNLATAIGAVNTLAPGTNFIAYVGISDASTAEGLGAREIAYNGVPYSNAAIQQGLYTFWAYEYLNYRSGYSGNGQTVANILANTINTGNVSSAGLNISSMSVSRAGEGGVVSHN